MSVPKYYLGGEWVPIPTLQGPPGPEGPQGPIGETSETASYVDGFAEFPSGITGSFSGSFVGDGSELDGISQWDLLVDWQPAETGSTVTFSGLSSTVYRVFITRAQGGGANNFDLTFNSDTTANYIYTCGGIQSNNTTLSDSSLAGAGHIRLVPGGNAASTLVLDGYVVKPMASEQGMVGWHYQSINASQTTFGLSNQQRRIGTGAWRNTTALVTSMTFTVTGTPGLDERTRIMIWGLKDIS